MRKPARRGRFVTLEGGEGAGKSTQLRQLVEKLGAAGIEAVPTREPGGSAGAEAIRGLILDGGHGFGPLAEALLFFAARADHLDLLIRPALARGAWVVCDRFSDSTRAYQGAAGGLPGEIVSRLERLVVVPTRPDLTIILDLPAEVGLVRAAARRGASGPDRFEAEALAFHRRLRTGFLAIAEAEPGRCVVVDAEARESEVAERIWQAVEKRLLIPAGRERGVEDAAHDPH
jgi:dTMP kinase